MHVCFYCVFETNGSKARKRNNCFKNKRYQTSDQYFSEKRKYRSNNRSETREKTTQAKQNVAEATTTEVPIATKKDEKKSAKTETVVYNGFADGNCVEVQKEDGSFEVMLVMDDALIKKLDSMDIGSKIKISYKAKAGQANKQIIKVN